MSDTSHFSRLKQLRNNLKKISEKKSNYVYELSIKTKDDDSYNTCLIGTVEYKMNDMLKWDGKVPILISKKIRCSKKYLNSFGHELGPDDTQCCMLDWKGNILDEKYVNVLIYYKYDADMIIAGKEDPKAIILHAQENKHNLVPINIDFYDMFNGYKPKLSIIFSKQISISIDGGYASDLNDLMGLKYEPDDNELDIIYRAMIEGSLQIYRTLSYRIEFI